MKIGVLTLPLHTNYGGVLQAYALQYSLRSMGHEAYLIDCRIDPRYANIIKYPAAFLLGALSRIIPPVAPKLEPLERQMRADKRIIRRNTEQFIHRHIRLKHYLSLSLISRNEFDAIVVGSDQVWRPQYFRPIERAYLDWTRGWDVRRIAYAASFGVDGWEYNPKQSECCSRLLSKFDFVSVRERSGVELCRNYLQCEAEVVLDPTMLVGREVYESLIDGANTRVTSGNMLVSFLDRDADKQKVVESLANHFAAVPFYVNSRVEDREATLEERIQPPVEEWLRGFIEADYVVTDSFHAVVFAIIFNKPFVAYANFDRGYTRFLSLLSLFSLESQLLTCSRELTLENCFTIEWGSVNEKLERLQGKSFSFLADSLR